MKFTDNTEARLYLDNIITALPEPYQSLCKTGAKDYHLGYGGARHHHAWKGGLLCHTAEVVHTVLQMSGMTSTDAYALSCGAVDRVALATAAIWHDYAKLYEYEERDGKVEYTDYFQTTGHVVGSVMAFRDECDAMVCYRGPALAQVYYRGSEPATIPRLTKIEHAMLAHHGRKEWGSPVEPASMEAWLLHSADMLSSRGLV